MRYVGASTKMYMGYQSSLSWMTQLRRIVDAHAELGHDGSVRPFVLPSLPVLESALRIFAGSDVWIGAQTCGWGSGALTGEVSPTMLAEMGVRMVEIGHAERRTLLGENEDVIRRKTAAALDAGLVPLLCVGEGTATDPEEAARFCVDQLGRALGGQLNHADQLILAYEPVWAIGASMPASPCYVNAVLGHLRRQVSAIVGDHATNILIIYGGSAGPGLLGALCTVDGLFLGRYAHKPKNFGTVLEEATRLGRATVRSANAIDETRSGRDSDQTSALRRRNIHD